MTRLLPFFFFLCSGLFALDVHVASGVYEGKSYSVLTLTHDNYFNCVNTATPKNPQDRYICPFEKIPITYPYKSQNKFFTIEPLVQDEKLYLIITPKLKSYIKVLEPLEGNKNLSKKWLLVGYEDKLPFIHENAKPGLGFKVEINPDVPLHVGSLDIDRTPMQDEKRQTEVKDFLRVKELFEKGENGDTLSAIDSAIKYSKESLFLPELLLYKMRTLVLLGGKEHETIDIGTLWVDTYTTHQDLPEVMLILAKANIDLGYMKEAQYYIDVLIHDYSESLYSQMAMIYKGERYEAASKQKEAAELYEKVLIGTKNVEMASLAAAKLAALFISIGNVETGLEYYKKIFQSNPAFFVKEVMRGYEYATNMASYSEFGLAAGISDEVLDRMDKIHPEFKNILLNNARWHAKAGEVAVAKERYEGYLEEFPFENNIAAVKVEYDKLFFDLDDRNVSARLASYDDLMKKYADSEIGAKAFYEKVLLLAEEHRYDQLKENLERFSKLDDAKFPDKGLDLTRISNEMFFYYLVNNRCADVVYLYKNYQVSVDSIYEDKLYQCLYDQYEYALAQKVADANLETTTGHFSIEWLGRKLDIYDKISLHRRAVDAGTDYVEAMKLYGKKPSLERYMKLLNAMIKEQANLQILESVQMIEADYPDAPNLPELYENAIKAAQKSGDLMQVNQYARKLYTYQNDHGITTYTPWIEFTYADSQAKYERYQSAVKILQDLLQQDLKADERSMALYTQSTYLDQLGLLDLSKKVLKRCVELKGDDRFSRLCQEAVKILEP